MQAVANVEQIFDEMLRVGRRVVISFPNFAYKALRDDYVTRGRSPKAPGEFDYEWYNTPNRRFPSIADVTDLCRAKAVTIHEAIYIDTIVGELVADSDQPNLNADTAIMLISR